jgi:Flp pilus assembly secretin CpaC
MTALFAYRRLPTILAYAALALLVATAMTTRARAADTLTVYLDQATITKVPENATTLVIGNPLIADVNIQPGGLLVVTGKGFGTTNLIVLDRSGAVLTERDIQVVGPQDQIVYVYRGVNRESLSCTPDCEARITLGDAPAFFDQTVNQAGNRTARAQGAAAASGPAR